MNIEDDLSASPVKLRQELRRLRALLPQDTLHTDVNLQAAQSIARFFCPILNNTEATACACTGACHRIAECVIKELEIAGFAVVRS